MSIQSIVPRRPSAYDAALPCAYLVSYLSCHRAECFVLRFGSQYCAFAGDIDVRSTVLLA